MKTYTQKEVEDMLDGISPTPWKGVCVEYVRDCNGSMGYEMNDGKLIAAAPDLAKQLLMVMDENEGLRKALDLRIGYFDKLQTAEEKLEVAIKALEYYETDSYAWDSADEDMDGNLTGNTIADSDGGQVASTALLKIRRLKNDSRETINTNTTYE